MIDKENLPKGWTLAKLGDICFTTSGGTPSRKVPKYYGGNIPWVKSGELNKGLILDTEEKITDEAIRDSSAKIFPKGTLLIALYGATVGKLAFLGIEAATNQAVCGIYKSEAIESTLLYYFLRLQKSKLIGQSIGGAQPNISQGIVKDLHIPLAPLNEQKRIIDKIEELITDLDKGIEYLETTKQQLKVYRQAVLKWAFEGKFLSKNNNWSNVPLGDVANAIDPQPSHRTPPFSKDGIPYVSTKDFDYEADKIDFIHARKVSKSVLKEHLERYKLETGDFVIGKIGTIGKPVRIVLPQDYTLSANIVLIQPRKINRKFLYYLFQSDLIESQFRQGQRATAQAAFGIQKVRVMLIPNPSPSQQEKIVHEIESRISVCDKIEETIESSLLQAEALRLSIIKKAFEGKLVPQNPSDEPAEKLLERIRAAKGKGKPEKMEKVKTEKKIKAPKKKTQLA